MRDSSPLLTSSLWWRGIAKCCPFFGFTHHSWLVFCFSMKQPASVSILFNSLTFIYSKISMNYSLSHRKGNINVTNTQIFQYNFFEKEHFPVIDWKKSIWLQMSEMIIRIIKWYCVFLWLWMLSWWIWYLFQWCWCCWGSNGNGASSSAWMSTLSSPSLDDDYSLTPQKTELRTKNRL